MEELNIKGLVVKSNDFGDNDKILTIITEEHGKITATVKGGKSLRSKFISVTEPFTYANLGLRRSSKYFYVFDSELIDDFYPLREDLERVTLASYICDVASEVALEGIADADLTKLTLNALYALAYKPEISTKQIKASYEFKAAVISGYMPELSCCSVCGKEPAGDHFIDVGAGNIICSDCISLPHERTGITQSSVVLPMTQTTLAALRFLENVPIQRFLSFKLHDGENGFYNVCEKYLTCHLEKDFFTLNFYKSIQ